MLVGRGGVGPHAGQVRGQGDGCPGSGQTGAATGEHFEWGTNKKQKEKSSKKAEGVDTPEVPASNHPEAKRGHVDVLVQSRLDEHTAQPQYHLIEWRMFPALIGYNAKGHFSLLTGKECLVSAYLDQSFVFVSFLLFSSLPVNCSFVLPNSPWTSLSLSRPPSLP